jgi:nitroreductase
MTIQREEMIENLVIKTRSFRRFYQEKIISQETLERLVEVSCFSGSAMNIQPIKYLIINQEGLNEKVFNCLGWAGYLKNWPGPEPGERPSAYIICCLDTDIADTGDFDLGIATQNILLAATEQGLGGCRIGSISPDLKNIINLPENLVIKLVLAMGFPKETVVLEEINPAGNVKYWRDEKGVHHVPKRKLEDVLIELT